jgi:hypothetical protein
MLICLKFYQIILSFFLLFLFIDSSMCVFKYTGWVDAPSNTFLLDPIGISLDVLPKFVVVDISAMTYFKSPAFATDIGEIKTFLQRVIDGKETALPINEKKGEDKVCSHSDTSFVLRMELLNHAGMLFDVFPFCV